MLLSSCSVSLSLILISPLAFAYVILLEGKIFWKASRSIEQYLITLTRVYLFHSVGKIQYLSGFIFSFWVFHLRNFFSSAISRSCNCLGSLLQTCRYFLTSFDATSYESIKFTPTVVLGKCNARCKVHGNAGGFILKTEAIIK